MNLIQQLSQTVTRPLLSTLESSLAVPIDGSGLEELLEQYYAILSTRLKDTHLVARLGGNATHQVLFSQVWINKAERDIIVQELAETYHLDETSITQLIEQATPNVYYALKTQAVQQSLPLSAYLEGHFSDIRSYLPVWVGQVIPVSILNGSLLNAQNTNSQYNNFPQDNLQKNKTPQDFPQSPSQGFSQNTAYENSPMNPADYRQENSNSTRRTINQRNNQHENNRSHLLKIGLPILALFLLGAGMWVWSNSKKLQLVQEVQVAQSSTELSTQPSSQSSITPPMPSQSPELSDKPTPPKSSPQPQEETDINTQVIEYNFEEGSNQPMVTEGQSQPIENATAIQSGDTMVFEFEEPVNQAEIDAMQALDELVNTTIGTDKVVGEKPPPPLSESLSEQEARPQIAEKRMLEINKIGSDGDNHMDYPNNIEETPFVNTK